jgi:hypothetical protein
MFPHDAAVKLEQIHKTAHLVTIPGGHHGRESSGFEFLENGMKEGNVRGIIQINPYFQIFSSAIILRHDVALLVVFRDQA